MTVAVQIISGLLIAYAYWKYASSLRDSKGLRIAKSLATGLNSVVIAYLITLFGLKKYTYIIAHSFGFWILLLGIEAVSAALFIYLGIRRKRAHSSESESNQLAHPIRSASVRWVLSILGAIILGLAGLAFFVPVWFHRYFGTVPADYFLFLISANSGQSTTDATAQLMSYVYAAVIFSALVGLELGVWFNGWKTRTAATLVSVVTLGACTNLAFQLLPLKEIVQSQTRSENFLATNYVEPANVLKSPEHQRNFIHIYMESVENSYYDEQHGGYGPENLMPDLLRLNQEAIFFTQHPEPKPGQPTQFGGPHQTFGAVHSLAAMVNMESGIPMKTSVADGEANMSYPNFHTVGDILAADGYNNEIMLGADANWGNLDRYYIEHGNFTVFDHRHAIQKGLIPPDYHQWWGYEDDKLYEYAKDELTRLSQEDKPFYFILENADTHFPDGYVSVNMKEKPFEKQYANVIFYSQAEVVKFVEWCKTQPWYENTTIQITGDHRSMDRHFFADWNPDYERTVVNMYINPAPTLKFDRERQFNRSFAPFDIFPTTLATLGYTINGQRLGIGTNLYSDMPTLAEHVGLETLNAKLASKDEFYFTYNPGPMPGETRAEMEQRAQEAHATEQPVAPPQGTPVGQNLGS